MKGRENKNSEGNQDNLVETVLVEQPKTTGESLGIGEMKLRLPLKFDTLPSNYKTKKINVHSNQTECENTQLLLSERTCRVNEFSLTVKQSLLTGGGKGNSIKSYLRMKPNRNVSFLPFQIYNNQTIVCDRSVYKFDFIFEPETQQDKIYEIVGKEVTDKFIEGYNGTIFAYGSTGSGKTYTMFGQDDGLVPKVVDEIFSRLNSTHRLSCSMLQIYRQNLIDLLLVDGESELKIKEVNNMCVIQNLSVLEIRSRQETLQVIKRGNHLKKIRETNLNESSSRSHIVFTFYLDSVDKEGRPIRAKFNLVDLAGSEKVFKSKVQGQGLEQAKKINLSLSCLGNTISALVRNSEHIPYRESKLTRILRESLMGNSITRLIVTCSISEQTLEQTISSIKFAQRAQKVQTQAEIAYNINRFKGQKDQKHKLVRIALEQAEAKLNKIKERLDEQPSECRVCHDICQVLSRRQTLLPEQMFTFNPINSYFSPKAKIDLRNLAVNPVSRFASVPREPTKKSSVKRVLGYQCQSSYELKSLQNKQIFELKKENEKLKEEKQALEGRLKQLSDKIKESESKNEKKGCRKVIKLGGIGERTTPKMLKENEPNLVNSEHGKEEVKTNKIINTDVSVSQPNNTETFIVQTRESDRLAELYSVFSLINQSIAKFQMACEEYKAVTCPFELEVLNEEISALQNELLAQQKNQKRKGVGNILKLYFSFKKSLCRYYEQITYILPKFFELSLYEHKSIFSDVFREKTRQISEIQFNLRENLQESGELAQFGLLLERQKCLAGLSQKGRDLCKRQRQKSELQSSVNQFLRMSKFGCFGSEGAN